MTKQKNKNFKIIFTILIFIILIFGMSCFIEKAIESSSKLVMDSIDGINMIIKEGTLTKTGVTIIIIDTTDNKNIYGGSCDYRIDRKTNNNWEELKRNENLPSYLQSFYVDKNNKLEIEIDWSNAYGELKTGEYRLVKNTEIKNKLYEFTVEFEIS